MTGIEGLPAWFANGVIGAYGINGLLMVFFWVVMAKHERYRREDQAQVRQVMEQHRDYMERQSKMYENNVQLVRDYLALTKSFEKLACDLKDVIYLNTQTQTRLVERIEQRVYPAVRGGIRT